LHVLFLHKDLSFPIKCDLCGECVTVCAPEAIEGRS
jgi:ferredoxin